LNDQFKSRIPKKNYWALVDNKFPYNHGILNHWMTRNKIKNKSKAHKNEVPNSKTAKLSFKRIKVLNHYCVLEIALETGRHHQIRAQLSEIGFPIKGDLKYGFNRSNNDGGICLHARSLSIKHPVSKETLCFTADPKEAGIWKSVLFD
jgi:23S rRNA pseudouridine1911/1915/1917 synthase